MSFANTVELLHLARAGDRAALASVLDRYRDRLLERIRLMMGPEARLRAESRDFLHDVMIDVVTHLEGGHMEDERRFLRWMTTVARNNIRDHVRKKREKAFENLSDVITSSSDTRSTPSAQLSSAERAQILLECLEELSEEYRLVIELRDLEALPFRAIGERLGKTESAAYVLHGRAMVKLGRLLERRGIGR